MVDHPPIPIIRGMKATHPSKQSSAVRRIPLFKSLPSPVIPPEMGYLETGDMRALLRAAQAFLTSSDPVSERLAIAGEKLASLVDAGTWLIVVHPPAAAPPVVLSGGKDKELGIRATETYGRALEHPSAAGARLLG